MAKRDAAMATADGLAYAIETEAKAQAQAIRIKGVAEAETIQKKAESLYQSSTLVDYIRAQQWNGQMPQTMMGAGQNVLWNMSDKNP